MALIFHRAAAPLAAVAALLINLAAACHRCCCLQSLAAAATATAARPPSSQRQPGAKPATTAAADDDAALLASLADPRHPEHQAMREWVGDRLRAFDRQAADRRVRDAVGEVPKSVRLLLGLLAGTFGGWVDNVIMRLVDILLSVPSLLLAVSIAAILGQNQNSVMIAIGVAQVPIFARLLRASMLQQRSADYVLSAQTLGLGRGRITMTHVLPNAVGPVIVQGTLSLATAVIDAAALSFLGLGGGLPQTAEWGRMLTYAQLELAIAPWLAFLPGACITITALGFTLLGEALREAMDPRTRAR